MRLFSKKLPALLVILAGIVLYSALPVMAAEIGVVIGLEGSVTAQNDQGDRTLGLKSPVFVQDTVITGPDGKVQILFNDETVLAQGPDSEITLRDYGFDQDDPGGSKFLMSFSRGAFRMITGKIAKDNPEQFNVQSPLATIGIRGTDFGGERDPLNNEEYWAAFHLDAGHQVVVTHRSSGQTENLLSDLQGVGANADGLGGVMNLPEERRRRFMGQTQISGRSGGSGGGSGSGSGGGSGDSGDGDDGLGDDTAGLDDLEGVDGPPPGNLVGDVTGDSNTALLEEENPLPTPGPDIPTPEPSTNPTTTPIVPYTIDKSFNVAMVTEGSNPNYQAMYESYYAPSATEVGAAILLIRDGGGGDYIEFQDSKLNTVINQGFTLSGTPVTAVYYQLGEYGDAAGTYMQWGYWGDTTGYTYSVMDYEVSRIYDVRGDLNTQTDASLNGHYVGSASGTYYRNFDQFQSLSGDVSCDINVTAGTVSNFSIMVAFDVLGTVKEFEGTGGDGFITGGQFNIINWTTITTPEGVAGPGHVMVEGGLYGPDAIGGVWGFQNAGTFEEGGIGEFHGQRQ